MIEPDFAILITAANRCVADRLVAAVAGVGGERMRPSFGFVLRAVAAEVHLTGADGYELSDRWEEAQLLMRLVRDLWKRIETEEALSRAA